LPNKGPISSYKDIYTEDSVIGLISKTLIYSVLAQYFLQGIHISPVNWKPNHHLSPFGYFT